MSRLACLLALTCLSSLLCAAEPQPRLALVDLHSVEDLIRVRVLAKPENAEAKQAVQAAEAQEQATHAKLGEADEQQRKAMMDELRAVHAQKRAAEALVESQIAAELLRVLKAVSAERYVAVLDRNYASEAILSKNAEMVDITLDVKEHLLLNKD